MKKKEKKENRIDIKEENPMWGRKDSRNVTLDPDCGPLIHEAI